MGDAFPYLTPSADTVRGGAWTMAIGDGTTTPLPDWLPAWDVSQELHALRQIEIDLDQVYAESRVQSSIPLGLSVVSVSEYEEEVYGTTFEATGGMLRSEIEVDLAGRLLGANVTLSTNLILRAEAPRSDAPIAWRRGSVLWGDSRKIRLYGDVSQFPVTEIDFSDCGLDPAAPWFLEIGTELDLPAMGSVQLLLNSRFPLVVAAARHIDGDRPELAVVRSQLFADVGRTLVEFALTRDEIEQEWPEDSLGEVLSAALATRFPEPLVDLRSLRDHDPQMWSARVAAAFGLLREPLG
jgi:hypothetical protein